MTRIFTRTLQIAILILFSFGLPVKAQTLYTQDFSITGNLTANGWTAHSGAATNAIAASQASLVYAGHSGSGIGNAVLMGNAGGEDDNITFASQSGNGTVVYF